MTDAAQQQELDQLKAEIDSVMKSIHEFDEQIEERNSKRLLLIENLRGLLPDDQFQRFSDIINKTVEAVRPAPEPSTLPPLEIDEENPLESLRKIRLQIAKEVCEVMGVEAPSL
ncbi:hypothetical protein TVAG_003850 [Trichomonas vaginalis G3]|uniref:Uncharacterized protein n=1 Tax=Trichomonas vaginalis (strain ATCC PRA-98 / G3) TaxID=412133 RepID=A2E599_TRIV3|nr:hypothetical protein TVAGG3_0476440 [Trichomonas vaginalis G3]EAY12179.1 hypothetical protein TVAG_003850 [Trichomonas vaginalis G3]KAI5515434.1 hypothetical protein TVAGG3_0476440 [Trichomonas vaginalis G3]|eukprot:XP_001324402.1 hypothetical protein [Trichomonas vaginalis G3]